VISRVKQQLLYTLYHSYYMYLYIVTVCEVNMIDQCVFSCLCRMKKMKEKISRKTERYSMFCLGGTVASWLVRSSPERVVWVRALAGDIVLCSWARHLNLTVPLSTQVYKWVPVNCWGHLTNCRGMTCDGLASCQGGVEILLAASCYRNRG